MTNILVVFYSRSGVTEQLALAIGRGAEASGAQVRIRRAREIVGADIMSRAPGWVEAASAMNDRYAAPTEADAEWADGIAFGSPTRFGAVSSELKAYIDSLGGLWFRGKLLNKAGAAFASSSTTHGGNETTVLALYPPFAHLGLIIVPNGYAAEANFAAGTPYGSTSVSNNRATPPDPTSLEVAHNQGLRLALVASLLKAIRPPVQ